jgi:osmotically-inducible protein OsmY
MTKYLTTYATVLTLSFLTLSLCAPWAWARAQSAPSQDRQDNTRINQRDRNPGEATADQQKANPADRDLTSKIRKAIVDDKSLSTYAHNVKVISQNGTVTLKGPVRSDAEMKSILAKAQDMAGADKVVNEMSVQPENVSK